MDKKEKFPITLSLTKPEEEWREIFKKGSIELSEEEIEAFEGLLEKLNDKKLFEDLEKKLDSKDKKEFETYDRKEFRKKYGF